MNRKIQQEAKAIKLIYAILITIVFEGLARKAAPSFLSTPIFFFKDFLCLLGLYFIINTKLSEISLKITRIFKLVIIFMFPLFLYNIIIDPILLLWGGKLYLLYFVLAILITMAFPPRNKNKFTLFLNFISFLIVPIVLIGLLELNLPQSHWLNKSVDGESLEHFSAAGKLRISSTFSFTGQYSYFLVFGTALFFTFFFLNNKNKIKPRYYMFFQFGIPILLLIGAFSTGGRTAVLGFFSIILIAFFFIAINNSFFSIKKLILPLLLLLFIFPIIKIWKPEYFAAYTERSSGTKNNAILDRVIEPFSQLTNSSLLGNGLGVMTNGSEKISDYAKSIRSNGVWTETDFATIIWEGGFYLVIVWYGFRLFIIFFSYRLLRSIKDINYYSAGAFLLAYILVQGLIGTLTIQPPLAIYFWICFGIIICIQRFDENDRKFLIRKA